MDKISVEVIFYLFFFFLSHVIKHPALIFKSLVPCPPWFIPLFEGERTIIANAQKMRGLQLDNGGIRRLFLSIRYTILPLVVSALSKVDTLAISMEGRAFGYRSTRTFLAGDQYSAADRVLIAVSVATLVLLLAFALLGGILFRNLQA